LISATHYGKMSFRTKMLHSSIIHAMKHFFLLTTLIATMCIAGSAFAQQNQPNGTFVFDQQSNLRIVAIDESPGRTMDASIFPTAAPETLRRYMPEGGAPASVTTFVLFAGDDIVLFDAGLGGQLWLQKMEELGVTPENVKLVLLTHMHGDHIGGLFRSSASGYVRRLSNARVLCAAPEIEHWLRERGIRTTEFRPSPSDPTSLMGLYANDFGTFNFGDVVFENSLVKVTAKDASGHTPGNTVFLVESKQESNKKLLILGDLLHAAALQFPAPEVCARFDMDHEKAIAARKRILDFAAQEKIPVAGMHFPSPSIGTVEKNDQGGYVYTAIGQ
jgi:glyoxylase-like metal-dependent hydrolase (beta-lactamase superfamily II)